MPAADLSHAPPASPARSLWWAPLLVFLLCLLAGGTLLAYLARLTERSDRAAFDSEVARTLDTVRERVETTVTLLRSTTGLFAASKEVGPAEFAAYVAQLRLRDRYPGVQGIGFSARVQPGEDEALLQRMRGYWGPNFRFWPPPQQRGDRQAIVFLEPQDERNRPALGYDMTEEPTRRAAMEAARDSGQARASGAVTLVQEIGPEKQAGLLIYVPLYRGGRPPGDVASRRAALTGFIYAPLRIGDLLAGARGSGPRRVEYELYDGVPPGVATLMLDTRADAAPAPRFTAERRLDVEGRSWLLRFSSHADFEASSQHRLLPWFALLVLAASALAAGTTYVQAREHRLVLRAAKAQRRNEAALKASEERERLRSQRLQRLAAATPALTAATSREAVLEALQQQSRQLLDAPAVSLLDGAQGAAGAPVPGGLELSLGEPSEHGEASSAGAGAAPLLRLAPRPGQPYSDDERLLLEHLGRIAAVALRNADLVDALRETDRRKDEFLAVLAHELRNPLAPLRTSLEILRRSPQGDAARHAREVAERQTAHMVRLIDDLLDVSRISHGTIALQRRRVALAEVVAGAVETARPALDARAHRLRIDPVDPALQLDGDATRLSQVFANLLVNAANYTPAGGDIELFARRDGEAVEVTVRDNGMGIEPELLGAIFEPFMQADRSSERSGGLGIGLMLVRRLAELHGGSVRAASGGRGLGSAFTVRLPLATRPAPGRAPAPAPAAHEGEAGAHRILVVDDNRDAAESLAAWLALDGHQVALAHDGGDALHAAADLQPELVLLDLGLPDLDGFEVARRLRASAAGSDLHLVAVTGWGQDEDRRRTSEAGFDLHLVKPVDLQALARYLHRLWHR